MITPTVFDLKVSYLHIVWSLLVSYTTHANGVSCGWDTSRKNWLKKKKTRPIQDIKTQLQIWNLVYFFGPNNTATTSTRNHAFANHICIILFSFLKKRGELITFLDLSITAAIYYELIRNPFLFLWRQPNVLCCQNPFIDSSLYT